jgi:C4-dicarboxylate transporter, DctM subunit
MAHGLDTVETGLEAVSAAANPAERVVGAINRLVVILSSIALVIASGVLTYSVVVRYFLKYSTDWQDEMSVFLVLGAVFMSAAAIQAQRHHVGIEAIEGLLPKSVNQTRIFLVDIASLAFCAYFAWKSYALLHEAIEDNYHSSSTWGPPLWIPYSLMTAGMVLLSVQLLLQVIAPARALSTAAVLRTAIALVVVAAIGLVAERLGFAALLAPIVNVNSVAFIGVLYGIITLIVMFAGMPIAFALGAVATVFMIVYMPGGSVDTITQNVYEEMSSITLLSIPLFILKGSAIGRSPAGQDLYGALHAWMHRIPGGLGIANVFACALFAAMAGSSPATCSAIGSAGIPEMRKRGYSGAFAAGIIAAGGTLGILLPPSITMILYAVAAEQSLGRLFLAAIGPALLLVGLFAGYAMWRFRREYHAAKLAFEATGKPSELLRPDDMTVRDKFALLPRVIPFVTLLTGVMVALYGGFATPSETAGLGAVLALILIAAIYNVWRPRELEPILVSTLKESTMLMFIIGMSLLYSYVMSYLHISQSTAEWIVSLHLSRWVLLFAILLMVVVLGFFLPPVSIILMTAPIILPPLRAAQFDLVWFGVIMTIVMEMGLIHPPVGLNIFVIKNIAPDIPLRDVIWGVVPFVVLMVIAVVTLCLSPEIATWLPDLVMGK